MPVPRSTVPQRHSAPPGRRRLLRRRQSQRPAPSPIAIIDDDQSALSTRIIDAFYPPYFLETVLITPADARMDAGIDTFALHIPSRFQRDLLAGHDVTVQLNVDATRMSQAFTGSSYILTIVTREVNNFLHEQRPQTAHPVEQVLRARFNPELNKVYFGAVMELVSAITMLAVVLTGAALISEREHGTVEHLRESGMLVRK